MGKLILVAGVSCSGKTTLARQLAVELDAAYISMDDYYRPFEHLSLDDRKKINFDAPPAIEHELLVAHVEELLNGVTVHKPVYDAPSYARLPGFEPVYSRDALVVEGLFGLYWPELRRLADTRVFVQTATEVCLQRRVDRDVNVYGRAEEVSRATFARHVLPNQTKFVLPTIEHAHLVISGEYPLHEGVSTVRGLLRAPVVL